MKDLTHIIAGCKKNDRACQEKLYREFYPALFALCKNFFIDSHQALTALNNGMLRVFKHIDGYDSSKGEFFNWVYTVVRHAALTHLRDQKQSLTVEITPRHHELCGEMHPAADDGAQVVEQLDKLPPATRVVCNLFYVEGFSVKEIAHSLNMKEGTVKWHLNEGRNKLKRSVNRYIDAREKE